MSSVKKISLTGVVITLLLYVQLIFCDRIPTENSLNTYQNNERDKELIIRQDYDQLHESIYGRMNNNFIINENELGISTIDDFQIVNLIITSDIEGNLNAVNRKTGELIWSLVGGQPLVSIQSDSEFSDYSMTSTTHLSSASKTFKKYNKYDTSSCLTEGQDSKFQNKNKYKTKNEITWIVEPFGDGTIYHFTAVGGLEKLPISIKQFIMNSPFSIDDQFVYTGSRLSGIVKINARTGAIVESFGLNESGICSLSTSNSINDLENSLDYDYDPEVGDETDFINQMNGDNGEDYDYYGSHDYNKEENEIGPFITLGKTIYELTIHSKNNTSWNITYVQWGPNNIHSNLITENLESKDNTYIQPFHDSSLLSLDINKKSVKWVSNLPYVTVNIFDVFLNKNSDSDYIILPHPIDHSYSSEKHDATFIDRTKEGSWYALSEENYPSLVRSAPLAKYISNERWRLPSIFLNDDLLSISISGVHDKQLKERPDKSKSLDHSNNYLAVYPSETSNNLPAKYENSKYGIGKTTKKQIGERSHNHGYDDYNDKNIYMHDNEDMIRDTPTLTFKSTSTFSHLIYRAFENIIVALICLSVFYLLSKFGLLGSLASWGQPEVQNTPQKVVIVENDKLEPVVNDTDSSDDEEDEENRKNLKEMKKNNEIEDTNKIIEQENESTKLDVEDSEETTKRKRKRGSRGGKKNKKKDSDAATTLVTSALTTTPSPDSTNDTIKEASKEDNDEKTSKEEKITKISNNLLITDKVLGFGSHGTIVFKGFFENRPVAVKRMLLDFYDVASHEINLLQESDDHSNVIRYFCSQENNKFLYIALELCSASLEDVIEKKKEELKNLNFNKNQILYQIANGVNHLHELKIVHRDIKPQNILVVITKKKNGEESIRFLISDFGLCKKLENDQSSFKGTTANAAGTSGWRAPELLLDTSPAYLESSKEKRVRLTRSVDIFSAGCVFFYVLTDGYHPFGDRYIREGNIIKGEFDLSKLNNLPDSYTVKDLISSMIQINPNKRPDINEVMKHPYFWSVEKKLDFLLKVSDRFEVERRDPPSELLLKLEEVANKILGSKGWFAKFDDNFIDNLGKYRKYNTHKLMDLLRAIRNKYHHYQDLPKDLAEEMGPLPDGFYWYFARKFPRLLLTVHTQLSQIMADDELLGAFF